MAEGSKFHINSNDEVKPCSATKRACRFGGENEHYASFEDAQVVAEKRLSGKHDTLGGVSKSSSRRGAGAKVKSETAKREADLRNVIKRMANNSVAARESLNDLNVDASNLKVDRSSESLHNAIAFAESRGNVNLMSKLATARAMSSSVIIGNDGTKYTVGEFSDLSIAKNKVKAGREAISEAVAGLANAANGKYVTKTDNGTFTVTVDNNGFNEDAFNSLSESTRKSIMKPTESFSIELAREHLSETEYNEIVTSTQTLDTVNGRPSANNDSKGIPDARTNFVGSTDTEKAQNASVALAELYSGVRDNFEGRSFKEIKEARDVASVNFKQAAALANPNHNTYIPGRSRFNGLLISGREGVDRAAAVSKLSPEKLALITVTKEEPNMTLAKNVLSKEDFDKIYSKRKVSLRVVEA